MTPLSLMTSIPIEIGCQDHSDSYVIACHPHKFTATGSDLLTSVPPSEYGCWLSGGSHRVNIHAEVKQSGLTLSNVPDEVPSGTGAPFRASLASIFSSEKGANDALSWFPPPEQTMLLSLGGDRLLPRPALALRNYLALGSVPHAPFLIQFSQ